MVWFNYNFPALMELSEIIIFNYNQTLLNLSFLQFVEQPRLTVLALQDLTIASFDLNITSQTSWSQ